MPTRLTFMFVIPMEKRQLSLFVGNTGKDVREVFHSWLHRLTYEWNAERLTVQRDTGERQLSPIGVAMFDSVL